MLENLDEEFAFSDTFTFTHCRFADAPRDTATHGNAAALDTITGIATVVCDTATTAQLDSTINSATVVRLLRFLAISAAPSSNNVPLHSPPSVDAPP